MLVIGRKPLFSGPRRTNEEATERLRMVGHGVWIGPTIRVRVLEVDNGLVRLGIDAPHDVMIARDELRGRET